MSDPANEPEPTPTPEPTPAPEPEPQPAPTPDTAPEPSASPEPEPGKEPEPKAEPTWPEDWRDRFASKAKAEERDKLMKRLARFNSPDNVLSSYLELERKVQSGALKGALPEDPTDEDLAAYRKQWEIPEKPEDYGIEFPEGFEPSDIDKQDMAEFTKAMHDTNAPAPIVKAAADWYYQMRGRAEQEMYEAAQALTTEYKSEIKAEWGREYDPNVRLGNNDMVAVIGAEPAKQLASLTLADGTKLGDYPDFVRYMVQSAKRNADDATLAQSEIAASGKSLDEAYNEALDLRYSDAAKYNSDEHQAKLKKLASAMASRRQSAA